MMKYYVTKIILQIKNIIVNIEEKIVYNEIDPQDK